MYSILLAALLAQAPNWDDVPTPARPIQPFTRAQLNHRQALQLYGLAVKREHEDRLVEATRLLEEARQLEPLAAPIHKSLVSLYLALSRYQDALDSSKQALDLEPSDHELWALYGRQLKNQSRLRDARDAYARALACDSITEQLDLRVQLNHDLGILNEELKDYDKALRALREVVQILDQPKALLDQGNFNPNQLREHAENTYERMIKICVQANLPDQAVQLFNEARTRYPTLGSRLNFLMARVESSRGQPKRALVNLQAYLQTQPSGAEPYEFLITLYRQLGRTSEMLPVLKGYADRDSYNVALKILLAREYGKAGQIRAAEALYQELAKTMPTADIYRSLFMLYQRRGQTEQILDQLNSALAKAPKDEDSAGDSQAAAQARAMLQVLREDADLAKAILPVAQRRMEKDGKLEHQTRYFLAVLAARHHQIEAAELFYRGCLQWGDPRKEAAAYDGLVQVLFQAKKYDEVVKICRQGLREAQATNLLFFHQSLAYALVYLGRNDEAITEANQTVDSAPEDFRLRARLSRMAVLTHAEHYADAVAEGQILLKTHALPGDVQKIRLSLYSAYEGMRDLAKAEEQLLIILEANPADATANNDLGYLWADQGKNLDEAERLVRKALQLDEESRRLGKGISSDLDVENAAFLDSLGWVLLRKGKLREAREHLEKAAVLSRGEEDPVIFDHLGDVYWRLEERTKALTSWRKSVQLYETDRRRKPDEHYKELKQKLQQLESETARPEP